MLARALADISAAPTGRRWLSAALIATALAAAGTPAAEAHSPAPATASTGALTATPGAPASGSASLPRATVLEVQRLFEQLGYPLGPLPLGGFGPRTRGALRYFQHKYGLPVTGLPDPRTLLLMRTVAASLRPAHTPGARASAPHDAVEEAVGHLPILAIAVGLAALLALLALSGRERPA